MSKQTTLLVVDDDTDLRETLADLLAERGYNIIAAEHGLAALQVVRQRDVRPDVILLDIMMPVMDGPTFAVERRKEPRLATVPVIAWTAHRSCEEAGQLVGAVVCLPKPLKLAKLLAVIESVTGGDARENTPAPH